jgi:D-proline reductase (dithiol) PrdB
MRFEKISEAERKILMSFKCPEFETHPWATGPSLNKRRISVITTAGLHGRDDQPFQIDPKDFYRTIRGNVQANDLVMSHLAASFDRTGFQRDWNVVFPLDRLRELQAEKTIGGLADYHYSFSSAHEPPEFKEAANQVADLLEKDGVNAVLLLPA